MSDAVRRIGLADVEINTAAVELIEGVLDRLRTGEARSVAVVEVLRGREVATAWADGGDYHLLNSGAARLAVKIASEPGEKAS